MRVAWPHAALVIAITVLVQVAIFDQRLVLDRVRLDGPLFLLIGIGFSARSQNAAILGFVLGISVDLFQFGPFGLHAFVFCLVAWSLAEARVRVLEAGRSFRTIQGALSSALVTGVIWMSGSVFGLSAPSLSLSAFGGLLLVGLCGGVLVHPATAVAQWMLVRDDRGRAEAIGIGG